MVYIVSDERIAVENFEQGKIYKVEFVDESILYGVCIGIGSDFVMLSGDISGYIFPLTMQTASQVSSIDLYTPIEPVPPPSHLLQYQTGVPPFSFNTSGTKLWSYYIQGNTGDVGDRTENLCPDTGWRSGQYRDGVWETTNTRSTSDFFPVSSNQYRLKINAGQLISFINFNYFDSQKQWLGNRTTLGMSTFSPTEQNIVIPQLPSNAAFMSITIRFYNDNGNPPIPQSFIDNSNIMVSEGTSEPSYEPYGYKIPVICGGQTTTIYIDNPLGADDILTSEQAGIQIPTIVGDNTLSVNTTVQPSEMQIVYEIDLEE